MASPVSSPKPLPPTPEEELPPPPTYTREAANPYEQYVAPPPPPFPTDVKHAVVEEEKEPLLETPPPSRRGWKLCILEFLLSCGLGAILALWVSSGFSVSHCDAGLSSPRPEIPTYQPPPLAHPTPNLTIHAAVYADRDITTQMQGMVTVEQTLTIDPFRMNLIAGDPWYGTVKSVVVLYQYEGREMEMLITHERGGISHIDHRLPVESRRVEILKKHSDAKSANGIIATVWGIEDGFKGLEGSRRMDGLGATRWMPCTNKYFGFDGFPNVKKTCVVFVQGKEGVKVVASREGRGLRLPAGDY